MYVSGIPGPHAHSGIGRGTSGTQQEGALWVRFITVQGYVTGSTGETDTGRVWRFLNPPPTSEETHECVSLSRSEKFTEVRALCLPWEETLHPRLLIVCAHVGPSPQQQSESQLKEEE